MKFSLKNVHEFRWSELYVTDLEIGLGISALRKLSINQEETLLQTKLKFEKIIRNDKTLQSLDPEHRVSYYLQIFQNEEWMIKELQRKQRYAIILIVFSFFEERLNHICNLIEKRIDSMTKLSNLKIKGDINKYWYYLKKVYQVKTKSLDKYFIRIKQQKIVRNIIAHQGGKVHNKQLKTITLVNGLSTKESNRNIQIDLKESYFINYLLDNIELFLTKLLPLIDDRYKEITSYNTSV